MLVNNATLTVFKSHGDAEAALRQLARNSYDLAKISVVGRDGDDERGLSCKLVSDGGATPSAKAGPPWGGIKGMLVGYGSFVVPGIGSLIVAGPLLTWIVRAMGTVVEPDKLDAMSAGLEQLAIPKESIQRCHGALKSGKVVLIAEGTAMAMILAREVLRRTPVEMIEQHVRLPE
jgi:hypothetical protein